MNMNKQIPVYPSPHSRQKTVPAHEKVLHTSSAGSPQQPRVCLLSLRMSLPVLEFHTHEIPQDALLWGLASFTQNVVEMDPCGRVYQ